MDDISLVQCRWLESYFLFPTSVTDACLMNPTEASTIVGTTEPELIKRDEELTLIAARED